jgi:hypothetical protein
MSLIPFAPFNLILVLFSFVYAAAVTHVLSTADEIIIASKRIRLSWFKDPAGNIFSGTRSDDVKIVP